MESYTMTVLNNVKIEYEEAESLISQINESDLKGEITVVLNLAN